MQLDRRRFCWTAISSAAALLRGPVLPADAQVTDNVVFVVESAVLLRSRALAEPAVGLSFQVQGDFSEFWQAQRRSQKQCAVVGLTSQGILACIELLARDTGRRILFRAEHKQVKEDYLLSVLEGPATFVEAMQLDNKGPLWSTKIQEHIAGYRPGARFVRCTRKMPIILTSTGNSLFSWVLGPCLHVAAARAETSGEIA